MEALESGDPDAFGSQRLDETLSMIRSQMRRFSADAVEPHAHKWHLSDTLIPFEVIEQMAEMGVFGLTVPEELGEWGLGKSAMVVVSETLSRGYIGVGSLGTRSEIAAELIRLGGTPEQKIGTASEDRVRRNSADCGVHRAQYRFGSGEPAQTRALRDGNVYRVTGNKTWTTHGARSDLMTLLVRTDPQKSGYRGLSMLLAEKPRGTDGNPFPAPGMTGGEIEVLGYRGMKEYEIAFDNLIVPASSLLGGEEGQDSNI